MKVINLYGGPGTGKSTTAAGLFSLMKLKGYKIEYVPEFAKDLVWDKSYEVMNNQLFVLANQHHRLKRLENQGLEYVVTDSPLLLSLHYAPEKYFPSFNKLVLDVYHSFTNIDIFLNRVKPYCQIGRRQDEQSAIKIDGLLKEILNNVVYNYRIVYADEHAPANILNYIDNKLTNMCHNQCIEVKPANKETASFKPGKE